MQSQRFLEGLITGFRTGAALLFAELGIAMQSSPLSAKLAATCKVLGVLQRLILLTELIQVCRPHGNRVEHNLPLFAEALCLRSSSLATEPVRSVETTLSFVGAGFKAELRQCP